jgi:RimJ/RimL family protein N-acetyltransferase
MSSEAIFKVECDEPEGKIIRTVYPLEFTPENVQKFWTCAKQFPSLYGKEILDNEAAFAQIFMRTNAVGEYELNGLLWVVDDFVGVFYLSDISFDREMPLDALVHYTFFDKRHKGRKPLVKRMIKHVFDRYKFQRLSAEVPLYTKEHTRHFITDLGFHYEGKRLKSAHYKDDWFDTNLYGILRSGVTRNGSA